MNDVTRNADTVRELIARYNLQSKAATATNLRRPRWLCGSFRGTWRDYRAIFADHARLDDLMDCLDVFVRAGWPAAQSLTFKVGEIWR
jgi:hypothetical protein